MIFLTTGRAWFHNQKVIIYKFPSSWRQVFEKLQRVKFLTIALSMKDIELGLKISIESFPSIKLHSVG